MAHNVIPGYTHNAHFIVTGSIVVEGYSRVKDHPLVVTCLLRAPVKMKVCAHELSMAPVINLRTPNYDSSYASVTVMGEHDATTDHHSSAGNCLVVRSGVSHKSCVECYDHDEFGKL